MFYSNRWVFGVNLSDKDSAMVKTAPVGNCQDGHWPTFWSTLN